MGRKPKRNRRPTDSRFGARDRWTAIVVCGFLLLAVGIVFGQTVRHDFVNYDDSEYVYDNRHVTRGLTVEGIAWAVTTNHAANWHPLTWLSHMLDCQLYGLHAGGHHLTSVLLHAVTAVLLFLTLWRMTGDLWPSALVAAVFAVHPLRTESVAWVAERKDVLGGLFFVLTLMAYVGYVRRPFSLVRYLTVVALFALGLMAKPMLVTLPLVLLLLDYWPLGRMVAGTLRVPPGRSTSAQEQAAHGVCLLLLEKVPLLLLTVASCVATTLAQGEAVIRLQTLPLSARITNALVSYAAYAGQFFYPTGLALFYPHSGSDLSAWKAAGVLLALAVVCGGVVAWRRRFPYLLVGWLWYLGMLVPVIGLVQVGSQAMADRYTYLPQIGLCFALVWLLKDFCRRRTPPRCNGGALGVISALAVATLMVCAWRQTSHWRDSKTIWTHTLTCTAENHVAHNYLGYALLKRGLLDEAIAHYQQALEIKPDYIDVHQNLGNVLVGRGLLDEAIPHYQRVLELEPNLAETHNDLGNILASRGRIDEAMAHYRKVLEIKPDHAGAHSNLGAALTSRGQIDEAMAHCRKALEIDPACASAHYNLGNNLVGRDRIDEAMAHYQKALEIKPDYAKARRNLDVILLERKRIFNALAERRKLLRSHPNDITLLNDVAWALATDPNASVRNGAEAVELARRAAELPGGRKPAILGTLAAAYAEAGRFAEAVETARKAVDLARRQNKPALAESIKAKIHLYEAGTPFREPSSLRSAAPTRP